MIGLYSVAAGIYTRAYFKEICEGSFTCGIEKLWYFTFHLQVHVKNYICIYVAYVNLHFTPPPEIHWGVSTKSKKKKKKKKSIKNPLIQSNQNSPGTTTKYNITD